MGTLSCAGRRLVCFLKSMKSLIRAIYWLLLLHLVIPVAFIIAYWVLYPLRLVRPKMHQAVERFLTSLSNKSCGALACLSGFDIYEHGADINQLVGQKCLVIINHQCKADSFPILAAFTRKRGGHDRPVWVIYKFSFLRWCPLGVAWKLHGNFFIQVGRVETEMARLRRHIRDVYNGCDMDWLVVYPEGAVLETYKKKSQEYARKHGYPVLEHTCLPRTTAFKTILEATTGRDKTGGQPIQRIVDVTMAWPGGQIPGLEEVMRGLRQPLRTEMLYRVYDVADIQDRTDEGIRRWLYDRWLEKEEILGHYYETGKFPPDNCPGGVSAAKPRHVKYSLLELAGLQLFWLLLFASELFLLYKSFVFLL